MPRAQDKSKRKTSAQSKSNEEAMISALDAWRKAHDDPTFKTGQEKFAREHGVPVTTFKRRLNGGASIQDFNRGKQKLDVGMEAAIVEWAVLSDEWGMAPSTAEIVNVANNMLRADGTPDSELISLDGNWGERKGDFTGVFGRAYLNAFVPKTVLAAFRATGIVPFNPAVITAEKMAPSLATSTCSSFPVVLPPHVERVAESFRGYVPSAFDLDPGHWQGYQSTNAVAGPSRLALSSSSPTAVASSPSSASRRRGRDPTIDPLLQETPTKRRRILTAALAASPSTRWLLTDSPITSPRVLPQPVLPKTAPFHRASGMDWAVSPSKMSRNELMSLAQGHMEEQEKNLSYARGTAFIQHLLGTKQAKQLHTKQKRKKTDRQQILFGDGKARLLTSDEIIQALEDDVQQKQDKEVEKEGRKKMKADLAERKKGCDEEWKTIQATHQAAIEVWKLDVENAKKEGRKGRSLPERPKKTVLKRELEVKWGLKALNESENGPVTESHRPDIGLGQGTSDSDGDDSD
ncbi:hypothetical protein C8F01DRAFT_1345408 [Mycena amicta]|nr:hypothetical protein C8F01DRAFT_1345408 [Mycena amicta]